MDISKLLQALACIQQCNESKNKLHLLYFYMKIIKLLLKFSFFINENVAVLDQTNRKTKLQERVAEDSIKSTFHEFNYRQKSK